MHANESLSKLMRQSCVPNRAMMLADRTKKSLIFVVVIVDLLSFVFHPLGRPRTRQFFLLQSAKWKTREASKKLIFLNICFRITEWSEWAWPNFNHEFDSFLKFGVLWSCIEDTYESFCLQAQYASAPMTGTYDKHHKLPFFMNNGSKTTQMPNFFELFFLIEKKMKIENFQFSSPFVTLATKKRELFN